MVFRFAAVLLIAVSAGMVYEAYGHGVGSETLPPQNLGDRQVFIEINAVTVEDSDVNQRFTFQMINMKTGEPVRDVTYQIRSSKQNQTLFDETFESDSGTLVIDFTDRDGETAIEKEPAGVFGFISGEVDTIKVSGPYFDYGGLYQFEIGVTTADSYSNRLDPPLVWNAGVSLADVTEHAVNDINFGEQSFRHTSYYDLIDNFQYDQRTKRISFSMPFEATFESINQTSVVHEEVAFSRDFGDLMVSEVSATVNGVPMPQEVVQIDDFTDGMRIIHLTVLKDNILELYDQDKIPQSRLDFVIGPSERGLPLSTVTKNGQFRVIMDPAPSDVRSGQELEISYRMVDVFLKDRPVGVSYDMYVVQEERVLFQTSGTSNDEAGGSDSAKVGIPEDVTGVIYVRFENLAGNPLASAKLPVVIDRTYPDVGADIPEWVRNSAGLWSEGLVSDEEFVRGIEFLISNGMIRV